MSRSHICPKYFKTCIDDLCIGSGCIEAGMQGLQQYHECDGCKALISDDDMNECTCEPDYDDDTLATGTEATTK